jgi:hypothetical protein
MKVSTTLFLSITAILVTTCVATIVADHAVAADTVVPLGVKDYLPACLAAIVGNVAHFFKKIKVETDTEIQSLFQRLPYSTTNWSSICRTSSFIGSHDDL